MIDFEEKTIYQFTISDIFSVSGLAASGNATILKDTLEKYGFAPTLEFALDDSKVANLISKYLALNAAKEVIAESESPTNDNTNEDIVSFLERFCKWLNETYPYYSKMIDIYSQNLSSLMAQVSDSRSLKTGVSEMPQTATFEEEPTTDVLSGLTKVSEERSSDYGTKMARIDEVRNKLISLYRNWSNEFTRTFMYY